jgi:hypothetical protein
VFWRVIMSSVDDDRWYYEQEAAMEAFIEDSLKNISIENAKNYLGTYGDAIQERVDSCIRQARDLEQAKHYGPASVLAFTAIELIIRFLLIRPLIQGAFLSDQWADILTNRIVDGRTAEDRKLLPAVLRQWSVDIYKVPLKNGSNVWDTIVNKIRRKRNKIVHEGAGAIEGEAVASIECAEVLLAEVVRPIAKSLGFTIEATGKWSEIRGKEGTRESGRYRTWSQSFEARSPFGGT